MGKRSLYLTFVLIVWTGLCIPAAAQDAAGPAHRPLLTTLKRKNRMRSSFPCRSVGQNPRTMYAWRVPDSSELKKPMVPSGDRNG